MEWKLKRPKIDGSSGNENMMAESKESEIQVGSPLGVMKSRGVFVNSLLVYLGTY